jgi:hypothetical protein
MQSLQNWNIQLKLRDYGINRLWIFGSYASHWHTNESDIDLLYEIDYGQPYEWRWPISALWFLEDQFGKKVDLINIDSIHPLLEKSILSTKKLIF